jgi:hypothetical protein
MLMYWLCTLRFIQGFLPFRFFGAVLLRSAVQKYILNSVYDTSR